MKVLIAIVLVLAVYTAMTEAQGGGREGEPCQNRFGEAAPWTVCLQSWDCTDPVGQGYYCDGNLDCCRPPAPPTKNKNTFRY